MNMYGYYVQQAISHVLHRAAFSGLSPVDAPLKDRLAETAARCDTGYLMAQVADALEVGLEGVVNKTFGSFMSNMMLWRAVSEQGIEPVSFFSMSGLRLSGEIGHELALKKSEVEDNEHEAFQQFKSLVYSTDKHLEKYRHPQDGAIITPNDSLRSHEAKLYHLFAQAPKNAGYLAVSKLMKDCRDGWQSELPDMPDPYLKRMRSVFHLSLAHYPQSQVASQMVEALHHYFLTQSMAFAAYPVAEKPEDFDWQYPCWKSEGFESLQFDEERRVTLAACSMLSGSLRGAARVLEHLIETPDCFAQALRSANQTPQQAQFLLKVCLYNQIMNDVIPLASIGPWIEDMRTAFVSYGFGDIVKTQALDPLVCNISAAELAEQKGYLRTEPMGITHSFGAKYDNRDAQNDSEGTAEHYANAMRLALRLEQHDLINAAAQYFFSKICPVEWPLCEESAQKVYVDSELFNAKLHIKNAQAAEKALKLGTDRHKLLQHPAMQKYAVNALELDMGL